MRVHPLHPTKFIGAHVSGTGGIPCAISNAVEADCYAFAFFLPSARTWKTAAIGEETLASFRDLLLRHAFSPSHVVPHGSYLLNCGSPDDLVYQKSRDRLVYDVRQCISLGLTRYNFHPGSTLGRLPLAQSAERIAAAMDEAIEHTLHVPDFKLLIENMAGQGHTVGGSFDELRQILERVRHSDRAGVCLDTCHMFAAGYDLRSEQGFRETFAEFEALVGFERLHALHLNDSKGDCGCRTDRHETVGDGFLGSQVFDWILNDRRFDGIPMILETPVKDKKCPTKEQGVEVSRLYRMVRSEKSSV
jgi:AP endonuclease-1